MAAPPTLHSLLEPWCCLRERGAREVPEMTARAGLALLEQKEPGVDPDPVPILMPGVPALPCPQPPLLPGDSLDELHRALGETPVHGLSGG